MWFQKKKQRPAQPFVPLSLDQVLALDTAALKEYQQAHARYVQENTRTYQEQTEAQIRAIQEQTAAHEREVREQIQQNHEEMERTLREIAEQGRKQMAQQQEELTNLMQQAFTNPALLAALQQALAPQPSAVPQLGNEQIIEGEILFSEEIQAPKKEKTHD